MAQNGALIINMLGRAVRRAQVVLNTALGKGGNYVPSYRC